MQLKTDTRIFSAGVTLVEVLVATAILAILLTVAVPSFQNFIVDNRASAFTNHVYASMLLARSEAIKRNKQVGMCKSSNGASCTGSWNQGWIVFVDADNNGVPDNAGTAILQVNPAHESSYNLGATPDSFIFDSQGGTTQNSTVKFSICPTDGVCRYICVPKFGTPRITKTNSDC
jgi:type IV fimbrial biogenesis protein FimT